MNQEKLAKLKAEVRIGGKVQSALLYKVDSSSVTFHSIKMKIGFIWLCVNIKIYNRQVWHLFPILVKKIGDTVGNVL